MKTIFLIFALLMVASCDEINDCQRLDVTLSPANPVEFWPVDCDTYNQNEVCGVHPKCFCAPWNCDDEIKVQFTDTTSEDEYTLKAFNEDGDTLAEVTFDKTEENFQGYPALDEFQNEGGTGDAWIEGSSPSVTVIGDVSITSSERLSKSYSLSAGIYELAYSVVFEPGTNSVIRFYKDGQIVTSVTMHTAISVSPVSNTVQFELSEDIDTITFVASNASLTPLSELDVQVVSYSITTLRFVHYAALLLSDFGICEKVIKLEIHNSTSSPDALVMKSDCLDVRTSHPCTYLWEYSNNKNILGLVYDNVSPALVFFIRVPMTFRIEDMPEEEEVMELTSSVEVLNSQIMEKKLAEIGYVPYYWHRKLKYILKHQFITIDTQSWVKGDEYKIIEGNKKWPLKMGEVWLTEKNSVQRVVL